MKFNFKKISAVVTSALMVGLTLGTAMAANLPSPYSGSTSSGVAIVSGTGTGVDDTVAANSIATYLATQVKSSGSTVSGGDSLKIEKSSTKINLADGMDDVWGASITDSNLPTLLADGTYVNDENSEYPYTQKIALGSELNFTHFGDADYMDKASSIGFWLTTGKYYVLNYTLDWTTNPESDVSGGDLVDIETTELTMLGKTYYILDIDNSTLATTLLDSAASTTLAEGESSQINAGGKVYDVAIDFIGGTDVKLVIDGEITNKLVAGGTQKLKDGSYVGIKEILTQDYAGGIKTVEFSIGKGKLEIIDASAIELNDVAIEDITGYISRATASGGKEKLDKIVLSWWLEDEAFLTPDQELIMPGFESIKFSMGNVVFPAEEETKVTYSGDDVIELRTTIKDGTVNIPILKSSSTQGNFTYIGKASDERLATTNNSILSYDAASGVNEGFIASWNNSRDCETYYLKAAVTRDSTTKVNKTTITNKVTGDVVCKDYETNDVCTIGNVELTMTAVNYATSTSRHVNITINDGGSFQRLYTAEGLTVILPAPSNEMEAFGGASTTRGYINLSRYGSALHSNASSFVLWMLEEDKNEDLGAGNAFNITLAPHSSTATVRRASATAIFGDTLSTTQETERSSKIWEYYLEDDVATNLKWDKTNADQYAVTVTYHGGEVAADVYLVESGVAITEDAGSMVFTDAEKSSWQNRDVILVGGSCINSATATALGVAYPTCESAFTSATGVGSGQYLIQSVGDAFTSGKIALVVAGYSKADTAAAAQRVTNLPSTVDTTAGNKYLGVVGVSGESTISKVA